MTAERYQSIPSTMNTLFVCEELKSESLVVMLGDANSSTLIRTMIREAIWASPKMRRNCNRRSYGQIFTIRP